MRIPTDMLYIRLMCVYTYMRVYMSIHVYICARAPMHTYAFTQIHVYVYLHIHMYTCLFNQNYPCTLKLHSGHPLANNIIVHAFTWWLAFSRSRTMRFTVGRGLFFQCDDIMIIPPRKSMSNHQGCATILISPGIDAGT